MRTTKPPRFRLLPLDFMSGSRARRPLLLLWPEQSLEARRWECEGEELARITVDRVGIRIADDLIELGGEVAIGQSTRQHIRPLFAGLDNRSQLPHTYPRHKDAPSSRPDDMVETLEYGPTDREAWCGVLALLLMATREIRSRTGLRPVLPQAGSASGRQRSWRISRL
jgi:hypothetical protein